jgi:hypothetical protein
MPGDSFSADEGSALVVTLLCRGLLLTCILTDDLYHFKHMTCELFCANFIICASKNLARWTNTRSNYQAEVEETDIPMRSPDSDARDSREMRLALKNICFMTNDSELEIRVTS